MSCGAVCVSTATVKGSTHTAMGGGRRPETWAPSLGFLSLSSASGLSTPLPSPLPPVSSVTHKHVCEAPGLSQIIQDSCPDSHLRSGATDAQGLG